MVRISVALPDEVAEALARAATERQSTREAMLIEAARAFVAADDGFEAFVADRDAFRAWIAESQADVDAGRLIPAEEVFAELDAIIDAAQPRKPE